MTHLTQGFNPQQYDPNDVGGGGGFPVGRHPVVIKSAELKPTSAGDGGLVEMTLEIIDGPSRGATGPYRLNLYNKSEKAARTAHNQLARLCHLTQQFQLGQNGTDLSVLFGIPFLIDVVPQKDKPEYTEVKQTYFMDGSEPGKPNPNANNNAAAFGQQQQGPAAGAGAGGGAPAGAWGAPAQNNGPAAGGAPAGGGWNAGPAAGGPAAGGPAAGAGGGWQQGGAPAGGAAGSPSWGPR